MPEKITILKDGGESINSNIVSIFMIPESGKRYIITTENAVDPHGLTVLHVSEIQGTNLVKIETDEEWSLIKTVMRAIISSSVGSYQYIPSFSQATASGQYSRDISVSEPASKQMIDSLDSSVAIVSNNFHIFRSTAIAKHQGLNNVYGISSPSDNVLFLNYMVREAIGILKDFLFGNLA